MSDQLRQKIEDNAGGPRRVRTDAGEVESHDLRWQIEADKYLSARAAVQKKYRGLRLNKFLPPSTY
jgi:hypothetical protein